MISARVRDGLLSLLFATAGAVDAQEMPYPGADTVSAGSRTLKVPPPAGYVRCDGINGEWDKAMQAMWPGVNRLLATYGTQEDLAALKAGEAPGHKRNCNMQIARSLEREEIGERAFTAFRAQLKTDIDKMAGDVERQVQQVASEGTRKFNREFGADAGLSVSDTAFLGYFKDSGAALGFTMAMNVKLSSGGDEAKSRGVVAAIVSPVNGRVINFSATLPYTGEADRTAAESIVSAWQEAVVAANPRVAGPEHRGGWFGDGLRPVIIGAVVCGLLVLVKIIFFKKEPPVRGPDTT